MAEQQVPVWVFMLVFSALFGLLQAIGLLMLSRLQKGQDENTAQLTAMRVDLPTTYATKSEMHLHHEEDKYQFRRHDVEIGAVRERISGVDNRITAIDGSVSQARAELR